MHILAATVFLVVISFSAAISNRSHRQLKYTDDDFYLWYQQLQNEQPLVYTEENREFYKLYFISYYGSSYRSPQQQEYQQISPSAQQESGGDGDIQFQTFYQGKCMEIWQGN